MPQHLFGDPRASMERLGGKVAAKGEDTAATEQATKQATAVLNRFLEHFSKIKEVTSPRLKELKVFLFFCIFHYRFQFLRSLGMPLRILAHEINVDSQLGAMGIQGQLEVGGDRGPFGFSAIAHGRQSDCAT